MNKFFAVLRGVQTALASPPLNHPPYQLCPASGPGGPHTAAGCQCAAPRTARRQSSQQRPWLGPFPASRRQRQPAPLSPAHAPQMDVTHWSPLLAGVRAGFERAAARPSPHRATGGAGAGSGSQAALSQGCANPRAGPGLRVTPQQASPAWLGRAWPGCGSPWTAAEHGAAIVASRVAPVATAAPKRPRAKRLPTLPSTHDHDRPWSGLATVGWDQGVLES